MQKKSMVIWNVCLLALAFLMLAETRIAHAQPGFGQMKKQWLLPKNPSGSYDLKLDRNLAYLHSTKSDSFDGLWRSQGYGYIVAIDSTEFLVYQVTGVSLMPWIAGTVADDSLFIDDIPLGTLSQSGDTLIFTRVDDNVIRFTSIDTLPPITAPTADPELNFEVFWHSFEENCALFTLTNVDWKATYNQYRPRVTATTTEAELFGIFAEMVTPLKDGHTFIFDGNTAFFSPGPTPASVWIHPRFNEFLDVITSILDGGELKTAANDLFLYGTIKQSIGYLNILAYSGYSENGDLLSETAFFSENLDMILTEFQNLEALIIDIRWNGGGIDFLGLALASRLTDQRRLGHSKQARFGGYDEFTGLHHRYFAPEGVPFLNKPVILLTSGNTASAADLQAMILKNLPNVMLIGETTYGIFSDILPRNLPNGWFFGLSNERFLSREGIDYEQIGIPPDIKVIANEDSLNAGIDNILSRALRELMITSVSSPENEVPKTFALAQNYPNPFNPETVIRYQLPVVSEVRLTIFNALGQEIRALVNGRQSPGQKSAVWDGKNDLGNQVNSGVYFYKLKADDRVQTKKMLLMR